MYCLRKGNDIPLTKGHTGLLEINCPLITLESPCFSCGECQRLDKLIKNVERGGFWSLDDLKDISKGGTLRKVKGLSNGSVVDCYIEDAGDTIYIYRPNPNAKNVYVKMDFEDEMNFRRNNWYL